MKDLLAEISSYNLFNYLLPGILFVYMSKHFTDYNFIQDNELIGVFLYYFIGMVISRFGSLLVEPILKWISFLKFVDYKSFILASKNDKKIELLSEVNNTYRSILALFITLLLVKIYNHFQVIWNISSASTNLIVVIIILVIFLFSYRKQTNYITKRIKSNDNP